MTTKITADNIEQSTLDNLGSGVLISNIQISSNTYVALDDTAVSLNGGFIIINGSKFESNINVLIDGTLATSVTYISPNEIRAEVPASTAGSKVVYVVNTDTGATAIRINGLTYSGTPTWVTGSTLPQQELDVVISIQLNATSDSNVIYSLASGSSLPEGLTLSANGLLSGTVTGLEENTIYNFTVEAIDEENQDSPRSFTITITAVYQISRSLRFNSADSAYLNRTPASASNRKTWTWSGWVKRGSIAARQIPFGAGTSDFNTETHWEFDSSDRIRFSTYVSTQQFELITTQVFRDPSAWYHIVIACDTTQATSSNRAKIYVNGVQVIAFGTASYPSLNYDTQINNTTEHGVGRGGSYNALYFSGYLTEINFIDGQALTPSSFGRIDPNTGVWSPKAYAGTYGTNGFYLNFSNNSSVSALGTDFSGRNNNWTTNNFSVAAGTGNDSLVDSPSRYGTDTGAGGEVQGNYATLNPLKTTASIRDGNLAVANPGSSGYYTAFTTMEMTSGKYYFEITVVDDGVNARFSGFGISDSSVALPTIGTSVTTNTTASNSRGWVQLFRSAASARTTGLYNNGASVNTTTRATTSGTRVFMVAYDADTGKCWMGYQGIWWTGDPAAGTSEYFTATAPMVPVLNTFNDGNTSSFVPYINFGQRPFAYTAPSGFKALCTTNLPTPTVVQGDDYFNTVLWTGTGGAGITVTGVGFQPDFVWAKRRSFSDSHGLFDAVRGTNLWLQSDTTGAEQTFGGNFGLLSFNSDGYVMGNGSAVNALGSTYVGWNWRANGAGVSNTDGTITSTVSVNTTSGFSIVAFTSPTGTGNFTVGHGLGITPSMVIVKSRDATGVWYVYHTSLPTDYYLRLNSTNAQQTDGVQWGAGMTSTLLGLRAGYSTVPGATTVAYAFAPVIGYSAFGSYIGNGNADGPFVYTGFRPRWILVKRSDADASSHWWIWDTVRLTYNAINNPLFPNLTSSEITSYPIDALSNGFKLRDTNAANNASGGIFIYAAFAENPFKFALAR
jgi:hypothetical protein